jgi:two-component system chemotaxis sensor kinase CheA
MHSQELISLIENAAEILSAVRGSLLLFAQAQLSFTELEVVSNDLNSLGHNAARAGLTDAATEVDRCIEAIAVLAFVDQIDCLPNVNYVLDMISRLEAEFLQISLQSKEFFNEMDALVETNLSEALSTQTSATAVEKHAAEDVAHDEFEVDEETLDIFRSEADQLLNGIVENIALLAGTPHDTNALWEIRRSVHTFKGAAGIVGFSDASSFAHRIEDLLDKMVDAGSGADEGFLDLLSTATGLLKQLVSGVSPRDREGNPFDKAAEIDALISWIRSGQKAANQIESSAPMTNVAIFEKDADKPATAPVPVIRVSLERLDHLLNISRELLSNRAALASGINDLRDPPGATTPMERLEVLIEDQRRLSDEMLEILTRLRMVRFGNLEMRLSRAVHVTCQEENKKATLVITNPEVEIDTQLVDALVEPLLHLLKNAVVHGIEEPEARRLLGKSEKGRIVVSIEADETAVRFLVTDDGRGVSTAKLVSKAVSKQIIDEGSSALLDEQARINLIFQRGLTTTTSLNLNSGRGIGMSIVKESVEGLGGSVSVESEPQKGTTFRITIPVNQNLVAEDDSADLQERIQVELKAPVILVVDDSQSVRKAVAGMIEETGLRAITAADGAEALELLLSSKWRPAVILSDIEMPNMDGWQLLEYIKTDASLGQTKIVILTSIDSNEGRRRALDLGASDYLVKPFSQKALSTVLQSLVDFAVAA